MIGASIGRLILKLHVTSSVRFACLPGCSPAPAWSASSRTELFFCSGPSTRNETSGALPRVLLPDDAGGLVSGRSFSSAPSVPCLGSEFLQSYGNPLPADL